MQLLKRIFDFYIFSNIHVAIAVFSLTKITLLFFNIFENELALFVFFATLLSYNFIRLYRKSEIKSWLYEWIELNRKLLHIISTISLGLLIYFGSMLTTNTLLTLFPVALFTLFYAVPFRGKLSLRTIAGFKLFLIAFCWATVTVILPIVNYELLVTKEAVILFVQRILFVMAITIPFDIRDVAYDMASLKTLPQIFGIPKTKRIGIFLLMLFLGLNFFKENMSNMLTIEFVVMLASLFLLVRSTARQNTYYSAFFVEAIPIFWLGLVLIK